jgi:MoaA/NifB/PqqE/SkfB family radical SAM enzyme
MDSPNLSSNWDFHRGTEQQQNWPAPGSDVLRQLAEIRHCLLKRDENRARAILDDLYRRSGTGARLYIEIAQAYLSLIKYGKALDAVSAMEANLAGRLGPLYIENIRLKKLEVLKTERCVSKPSFLQIFLTHRCNLNCIMCQRVREKVDTLPPAAMDRILPFIPFADMIGWQGGEVFLVDYFKDTMAAIGAAYPSIEHYITTNGLLISRDWAELLAEIGAFVRFSIDSPAKTTYEYIRAGGSFDTLIRNLDAVKNAYHRRRAESNQYLALNVLVMKSNLRELPLFPAFCRRYGIGDVYFSYLYADLVPGEDIFNPRDEALITWLRENLPAIEAEFREAGIHFVCGFPHLLAPPARDTGEKKTPAPGIPQPLQCIYPWTGLQIGADGKVRPTCDCVFTVGNIFEEPLEDIWNNEAMTTYRRKIITGTYHDWCARQCLAGVVDVRPPKFKYI